MLASVDVGSNTLRLLIGEVVAGEVRPESYQRHICRLAGDFTVTEGLSAASRQRVLSALQDFAESCSLAGVERIRAVGTAAFRMAVNGPDFMRQIRQQTQLPLDIITGELEAEYMASGVLSALNPRPAQALLVDIGGGSTELVLVAGEQVLWAVSLPLGVVRLTEGYPDCDLRRHWISRQLESIKTELVQVCEEAGIRTDTLALVGTAGTVTTLAALDLQMAEYDWRRVNNYRMTAACIDAWQDTLRLLPPAQRETLPGMESGRGDLIMAGIEIIQELMTLLDAEDLWVSDFGLLEGLLLSLESSPIESSSR